MTDTLKNFINDLSTVLNERDKYKMLYEAKQRDIEWHETFLINLYERSNTASSIKSEHLRESIMEDFPNLGEKIRERRNRYR